MQQSSSCLDHRIKLTKHLMLHSITPDKHRTAEISKTAKGKKE